MKTELVLWTWEMAKRRHDWELKIPHSSWVARTHKIFLPSTLHNFDVWHQLTYAIFKTFFFLLWLVNCLNFVFNMGKVSSKLRNACESYSTQLNEKHEGNFQVMKLFFFELFHSHTRTNLHHSQHSDTGDDKNEMKFNSEFSIFSCFSKLPRVMKMVAGGGKMMRRKNIV